MADDVAITAGSGTAIATDQIGAGHHYQRIKITDGVADSEVHATVGSNLSLYVDPHPATARVQTSAAGLTTATTAYTSGDMLGTIWTFANAVRVSGSTGEVRTVTLMTKVATAGVPGATELWLFDRSVTQAADNAANNFSDADMLFCLGVISIPAPTVSANNAIATVTNVGLTFKSNATSIFGCLITRSGHTFFGAATDIVITLTIAQD